MHLTCVLCCSLDIQHVQCKMHWCTACSFHPCTRQISVSCFLLIMPIHTIHNTSIMSDYSILGSMESTNNFFCSLGSSPAFICILTLWLCSCEQYFTTGTYKNGPFLIFRKVKAVRCIAGIHSDCPGLPTEAAVCVYATCRWSAAHHVGLQGALVDALPHRTAPCYMAQLCFSSELKTWGDLMGENILYILSEQLA